MIFKRTTPPPQIPPTGPQQNPASPQPADIPADDSPDIPYVSTPDNSMSAAPVYPSSAHAMAEVYRRASLALEEAAKRLSVFPECRIYQYDAASYAAGVNLNKTINLKGMPIRSVFVSFGTPTSAGNATVNMFVGDGISTGLPLMSVRLKTFQIMPIGSGVFDLTIAIPSGILTSTPITVVVSDEVWAPSFGMIV